MAINYKKELEAASRTMILVHDVQQLIKMIVRTLVQKVKIRHAGILLYEPKKNSYILTVSRGELGVKIPKGFARLDVNNPIIEFFTDPEMQKLIDGESLIYNKILRLLKNRYLLRKYKFLKKKLIDLKEQLDLFDAVACIPSYFNKRLLGILLLGKKNSGKAYSKEEIDFFAALSHDVAMAIRNAQLIDELQRHIERNKSLFTETTRALAAAIDAKDHYTHGHTSRVTKICLDLARKLKSLGVEEIDDSFIEDLNIAALLHDIGKIGVPEEILNKNSPLTEEERRKLNEHPVIGASIIQPIQDIQRIIAGVKYHHERFDGKGYPEGLREEQIPLIAAIIAVADSYDAMITQRPYRLALSKSQALEEIKRCTSTQFHPQVVKAFEILYHEGTI